MFETERIEKDAPESSVQANTSRDRQGATDTAGGVPLRKLSHLSEREPRDGTSTRSRWSKLWEADPPAQPLRLGPGAPWPKVRRFVPSFLTSALMHAAVTFFLLSVPFAALLMWLTGYQPPNPIHRDVTVVDIHHLNLADYLPRIHPPGHGKAPGRGAKPGAHPRLGHTHFDPRVTIVSNPPNPDNFRLTLKTENAPPTLKLPNDLKIPDFISGGPAPIPAVAKAPIPAPPKVEKPVPPAPSPTPPPAPVQAKIPPPPVVPVVPHVAPVIAQPPPPPPTVALAMPLPNIPVPRLEVPPPPPPVKDPAPPVTQPAPAPTPTAETPQPATAAAPATPASSSNAAAPGEAQSGGGPKILALSADPVPFKDLSQIPAGQHEGAFSVSPNGTDQGSPGGVPGGELDVGEGGQHGPGGDKSVAVGNGKGPLGGGGHDSSDAATPSVSVSGTGDSTGSSAGALSPINPADLVFPVKPETPKVHAPNMVVSSGSGGGGGLSIYGVLRGDKIYTVYLSMPGKSWILQYCVRQSAPKADPGAHTVQVTMAPPLTPPGVIEQFDFHRLGEPPDPSNGMIVLHGFLREDGTVSDLKVLQSVEAIRDAAASAAFARWKFKPALRAGAPVALEILVGIP